MQKKIILEKIDIGYYKLIEYSDKFMYTLYLFLSYGPFPDSYIDFLQDNKRTEFYGNVANLEKKQDKVTIEIDEFLMPDIPACTIDQKALLELLKKYNKYKNLGVDKIEITLENDALTIVGDSMH